MRVVLSARAQRNLVEIGLWIAQDNPDRAFSFIQELRTACHDLSHFPRAYTPIPQFGPEARRRTHGNYVILYDVEPDRVLVLAIIHGARDIGAMDIR